MRLRFLALHLFLLCGFARSVCVAGETISIAAQLTTAENLQLQREARVVVDLLQNYNYAGRAFREFENKEMISRYVQELDPQYYFLTKEDTDFLRRRFERTFKTVYLYKGDLRPAFEIFDYFSERARERLTWIEQHLAGDFDLTTNAVFNDPAKPEPPADKTEADRRWSLRLKEQILREILAGRTLDNAPGAPDLTAAIQMTAAAIAKEHPEATPLLDKLEIRRKAGSEKTADTEKARAL